MKKRILTILLAGLLTMSAVACANNPSQNPGTTSGSNDNTTATSGTTGTTGTTGNNSGSYQDVNEKVYAVIDKLNLRTAPDTSASSLTGLTVNITTEMVRTKYNSSWSKVTYEGKEYYVSSAYLTTDDIGARYFTAHAAKTMYATDSNVRVRLYPTTHSELSKPEHIIKKLEKNDTVTVVGTSEKWYQISMEGKLYYVSVDYLSATEVSGQSSLGNYIEAFREAALPQAQTMYISTEQANLRLYPSNDNAFSYIIDTYQKNDAVTVVSKATINGTLWAQILVYDAQDPAAPPARYYISHDCLTPVQGGTSIDLPTLLSQYPTFKTYPETVKMYVSNKVETSMPVRTSPVLPNVDPAEKPNEYYANCLDSALWPKAKAEISVVAYGTGDHTGWYIISYENGFHFVKAVHLTTNANGEPVLTLDIVLSTYTDLKQCTEEAMVILKDTNYYSKPTMKAEDKLGTYHANDRVTVIAKGTVGAYGVYVIKDANGNCMFITSESSNVSPVAP